MKKNQLKKPKILNSNKTFGPIKDFEKHLSPNWWKEIFNAMYIKTDADVVDDSDITRKEIDIIKKILNIKENDSLLDLACGHGRHLVELNSRGNYHLFGIDRSRYIIQKAKKNSKKNSLNISWKEGDARRLPYQSDSFDFVTNLGNSFGYFESVDHDANILKEIFRVLKPGGILLMDLADGSFLKENFAPRSWEWIDKNYFVCRERKLSSDNQRLISREIISHSEKGVIVDQFYAERLYSKEELVSLLESADFKDITFHVDIETQSERNEDLGMMQKRFVLTAKCIKDWSPRKTQKENKNVFVIMGDPSLEDVIKPNAIFDKDDFETIDKLKEALFKNKDYNYQFLNNHKSLISDLQKNISNIDMVFNLCDEGFNNDALKELHVPSLLEIMNIPYTGSNPQTLAYCYDKSLIRGIASEIGVPVADAFVISGDENLFDLSIPFPIIAKPNFGDSSFGITQKNVAYSLEEFTDAIQRIRKEFGYSKPILVEEFLTGAELSVGIIGNIGDYKILPIIEEDYSNLPENLPKICGYEAKWIIDSPYMNSLKSIPATISEIQEEALIQYSLKLFERLNCRDYCRFDWRMDANGNPKLLEVNPNPGWCWDGHLAKMCQIGGISYSQMLELIVQSAIKRYSLKK